MKPEDPFHPSGTDSHHSHWQKRHAADPIGSGGVHGLYPLKHCAPSGEFCPHPYERAL